jgi:hypothetical protein
VDRERALRSFDAVDACRVEVGFGVEVHHPERRQMRRQLVEDPLAGELGGDPVDRVVGVVKSQSEEVVDVSHGWGIHATRPLHVGR